MYFVNLNLTFQAFAKAEYSEYFGMFPKFGRKHMFSKILVEIHSCRSRY